MLAVLAGSGDITKTTCLPYSLFSSILHRVAMLCVAACRGPLVCIAKGGSKGAGGPAPATLLHWSETNSPLCPIFNQDRSALLCARAGGGSKGGGAKTGGGGGGGGAKGSGGGGGGPKGHPMTQEAASRIQVSGVLLG